MRFILLLILSLAFAVQAAESGSRAAWITLEGEVDNGMADYTKRAIGEALKSNPDIIVFEINTFGGLLSAAFDIVDTITAIKNVETVAYVSKKAISAGALIALSCNRLYMKPSTTIGDCAPIIQSQEGPQILGEKIQSPLRAKFRNLAQRNNYPELLSESMVTPELEVIQLIKEDSVRYLEANEYDELSDKEKEEWGQRKTIVREGELLTLTDIEAVELGFSEGTIPNDDSLKTILAVTSSVKVEISWAETLARFIGGISPILMILAFGALYLEFQTPGFGIFGITGITLLAIVFGGQYVSGLTDQLPLVLFVIGIILVLVEVLVFPGTMIAGITSLGFFVAALVVLMKDVQPTVPLPVIPGFAVDSFSKALTMVFGSAIIAMIFPVLASRYLLPRLPKSMSPVLSDGLEGAVSPHEVKVDLLKIGEHGVTVSILKPTGRCHFGTQTVEAESRDGYLDAGVPVVVVEHHNGRIIVGKVHGGPVHE
jgi:membrane-bound serine protease (ClpP class)